MESEPGGFPHRPRGHLGSAGFSPTAMIGLILIFSGLILSCDSREVVIFQNLRSEEAQEQLVPLTKEAPAEWKYLVSSQCQSSLVQPQ